MFAGFLSAFLIELLGRLEPDPMDVIKDVLIYQTQMMRNSTLEPYVPPDFSPPVHIVVVNALFYASLGVMILAALIAMLIKSWVREFDRDLKAMSLPEQRAKTREFRYLGMVRWKLPYMVGILPSLIQVSLVLFSIGLILFLFYISTPSFGVTTAIFGVGMLYYAITTSISVVATSSPFRSPLSRKLNKVYQHAHAQFRLFIHDLFSSRMDTNPIMEPGEVGMRLVLQKIQPYPEKDFAEPIKATTIDEVQLSTAASALQRIHDSAPNARHSEALQWSVWQVAGGTALRIPPLFDLPSWILDIRSDAEYFSHLPPAMAIAFVAVWLRVSPKTVEGRITAAWSILDGVDKPVDSWSRLVIATLDHLDCRFWEPFDTRRMRQTESNLINMIRRDELQVEECLWLLRTMSELHDEAWQGWMEPSWIRISLALLMNYAPKWHYSSPPDVVLLESVVTLAATSCSLDKASWRNVLTNNHEYPRLLLNIRNPNLINMLFEGTPSSYHKQLISLLFLVVYALIYLRSYPLAVRHFTIITAKRDLPLYASALTAIAPALTDAGISAIGRMLMMPQTQVSTEVFYRFGLHDKRTALEEMFNNYDEQLGASENPDENCFSILLMLSKGLLSDTIQGRRNLNLRLKNPSLQLIARTVARLDIPDGPSVPMDVFHDHQVQNMIAALSLLRYTGGEVTQYTESLLLASFLRSRELAISSVALEHYMRTAISHSDPSAPSRYLSTAVSAVFNFTLPNHQLWMGWEMLDIFVGGLEQLSVEWQRTFAEGFFNLSRRPLLGLRGDMELSTPESELQEILTWEYFHAKEPEPEFTDSEFSGLDWMAMAWSLHLSQQSGRKRDSSTQGGVKSQDLSGPTVDGEFVLRALCKLLDAVPYYQIIPIAPNLHEFVQWFDDIKFSVYRCMISTRVERAVRKHEEYQMFHKFHKFHCILYT